MQNKFRVTAGNVVFEPLEQHSRKWPNRNEGSHKHGNKLNTSQFFSSLFDVNKRCIAQYCTVRGLCVMQKVIVLVRQTSML